MEKGCFGIVFGGLAAGLLLLLIVGISNLFAEEPLPRIEYHEGIEYDRRVYVDVVSFSREYIVSSAGDLFLCKTVHGEEVWIEIDDYIRRDKLGVRYDQDEFSFSTPVRIEGRTHEQADRYSNDEEIEGDLCIVASSVVEETIPTTTQTTERTTRATTTAVTTAA